MELPVPAIWAHPSGHRSTAVAAIAQGQSLLASLLLQPGVRKEASGVTASLGPQLGLPWRPTMGRVCDVISLRLPTGVVP